MIRIYVKAYLIIFKQAPITVFWRQKAFIKVNGSLLTFDQVKSYDYLH
jgi:hypothetical protein